MNLRATGSVAPIEKGRLRTNLKPSANKVIISVTLKRDKLYFQDTKIQV